jgi:protein Tex
VGVHQDGLVHISQLADSYVDDPNKIVKVGQRVWVTVVEVDVKRKRIALSMKGESNPDRQEGPRPARPASGINATQSSDMASALAALKSKFGK